MFSGPCCRYDIKPSVGSGCSSSSGISLCSDVVVAAGSSGLSATNTLNVSPKVNIWGCCSNQNQQHFFNCFSTLFAKSCDCLHCSAKCARTKEQVQENSTMDESHIVRMALAHTKIRTDALCRNWRSLRKIGFSFLSGDRGHTSGIQVL